MPDFTMSLPQKTSVVFDEYGFIHLKHGLYKLLSTCYSDVLEAADDYHDHVFLGHPISRESVSREETIRIGKIRGFKPLPRREMTLYDLLQGSTKESNLLVGKFIDQLMRHLNNGHYVKQYDYFQTWTDGKGNFLRFYIYDGKKPTTFTCYSLKEIPLSREEAYAALKNQNWYLNTGYFYKKGEVALKERVAKICFEPDFLEAFSKKASQKANLPTGW